MYKTQQNPFKIDTLGKWKSQEAQNMLAVHFIFLIVVSYFFSLFSI